MKKRLTILRTAVGSPPAMGLVRELKKRNIRVVGLDSDPYSAGLYLCNRGYVIPRGDDVRFLDEILKICDIEEPRMIISGPEEEVLSFSKNKEIFDKRGIVVLVPPYESAKICSDKLETWRKLKELSLPVPEVYESGEIEYPCIIKPRRGRGSQDIFIAENAEELRFFSKRVRDPIIQEYVSGIECSVDTFADMGGNPLSIVPRIRLRVESGVSIKGITFHDEKIIRYCQKIVKKLNLSGPACIQCIKKDDEVKFTEINARFGGGSILSIKADPSIMSNLIRMARGERPIPSRGFREGLVMLRYYSEVFVPKKKVVERIFL